MSVFEVVGGNDRRSMIKRFERKAKTEAIRELVDLVHCNWKRVEQLENLLLWTLYHHQGGKSEVGQPIRQALGIDQHASLTPEQIEKACRAACKNNCKTWLGHSGTGRIICADCGRLHPDQASKGAHS